MANKKSGMVNALIIANAILALVIGVIVWMLVSKKETNIAAMPLVSQVEKMPSAASDEQIAANQAAIEKLRQELLAERQKAEQQQRAEQQKIQQLMQQLSQEKQRNKALVADETTASNNQNQEALQTLQQAQIEALEARKAVETQLEVEREKLVEAKSSQTALEKQLEQETALAEKMVSEKQRLEAQLKREQARVDQMASSQAKTDLDNRRLIEQLRAQIKNSQQFAQSGDIAAIANTPQAVVALDSAVAKASKSDKDYIRALEGDVEPYIQSDEQKRALSQAGTKDVDYFNRVVVASNSENPNTGAITNKVDELLAKRESNGVGNEMKMVDKTYLKSLDPLAQQREAESRFITVKRGDTLSDIAVRAYGDWRQYRRIFEANPQILVNPDLIYPGQELRVPL